MRVLRTSFVWIVRTLPCFDCLPHKKSSAVQPRVASLFADFFRGLEFKFQKRVISNKDKVVFHENVYFVI